MLNIFKKKEKFESKLKNLSAKAHELNDKELKKVVGGAAKVKSHSNTNNN